MTNETPHNHPIVEKVLNVIANWVKEYQRIVAVNEELRQIGPEEVMTVARDLGITPNQFREILFRGPHAAELLSKMLLAMKVDPSQIEKLDPSIAHDLKWICITCPNKSECRRELSAGTATEHKGDFCPNAIMLDSLFTQTKSAGAGAPKTAH